MRSCFSCETQTRSSAKVKLDRTRRRHFVPPRTKSEIKETLLIKFSAAYRQRGKGLEVTFGGAMQNKWLAAAALAAAPFVCLVLRAEWQNIYQIKFLVGVRCIRDCFACRLIHFLTAALKRTAKLKEPRSAAASTRRQYMAPPHPFAGRKTHLPLFEYAAHTWWANKFNEIGNQLTRCCLCDADTIFAFSGCQSVVRFRFFANVLF